MRLLAVIPTESIFTKLWGLLYSAIGSTIRKKFEVSMSNTNIVMMIIVYEQNFIIRNQPKNIYSIILYISCRNMVKWIARMHDYTIIVQYIQPGSLTQKYETFRSLFFTWQDSSAGAMVSKLVLP